jgi:outer membrane immunogenic protein
MSTSAGSVRATSSEVLSIVAIGHGGKRLEVTDSCCCSTCKRARLEGVQSEGDVRMKKLLLTTAAFGMLALPAMAADMAPVYKAPVPIPAHTWTGLYVGVNAGANWGSNDDISHTGSPGPCDTGLAGCLAPPNYSSVIAGASTFDARLSDKTSFFGGGQIGYNYQLGTWVAGVESDIVGLGPKSRSGNFATTAQSAAFPAFPAAYTATVTSQLNYLGTLRGRLGFLARPSFLLYGTAGLAYGEGQSTTAETFNLIPGCGGVTVRSGGGNGTASQTRLGWTAGAGVEWMFAPRWSLKGEYLYYDLGNFSYNTSASVVCSGPCTVPGGVLASSSGSTSFHDTGNIVRAGLNYQFWSGSR